MTLNFRQFFLLLALSLSLAMLPCVARAETITAPDGTMILTGALTQSSDGKVFPSDGDVVSVVNVTTKQTLATGTYGTGSYGVVVTEPASFNGTQIMLRITHTDTIYRLLKTDGSDSIIQFSGSFLPVSTQMNLVISSVGGTGTGTGTGTPPPPIALGDLNGDGVINEVDVGLLKQAISGQTAIDKTKMDINGDQVVNTRDLIDLIRMVRENSRIALKPVSIIPKH